MPIERLRERIDAWWCRRMTVGEREARGAAERWNSDFEIDLVPVIGEENGGTSGQPNHMMVER